MTAEPPTLIPCPICGRQPVRTEYHHSIWYQCQEMGDYIINHRIMAAGKTDPEAVKNWNRRVEPFGNSDELPAWMRNKLSETIIDCGLLEEELRDNGDVEEAVRISRRVNTLRWVLSLKKPEEKP